MQLRIMLESMDYKHHLDDIIVVVSGVDEIESAALVDNYSNGSVFSLKRDHVLTTSLNMDEYGSFVELGRRLRNDPSIFQGCVFLILHDTCEAGRLFWDRIADVHKNIGDSSFCMEEMSAGGAEFVTRFAAPMAIGGPTVSPNAVGVKRIARCKDGKTLRALTAEGAEMWVDKEMLLRSDIADDALLDVSGMSDEDIHSILLDACLWIPVSTNFNFGVATRKFMSECLMPAFVEYFSAGAAGSYTKEKGIAIEIDRQHPLNLMNLAKQRWRFLHQHNRVVCMTPVLSYWKNDTDVYKNGVLRNVSYLPALDLKKYTRIVGPLALR